MQAGTLPPPYPQPYIPYLPQGGVPHMAGSKIKWFLGGWPPHASFPLIPPCKKRFPMGKPTPFYTSGARGGPPAKTSVPVVNRATEEAMYEVAVGSKADVDKAVAAAKRAFVTYSQTSREERVALLTKVIEIYKTRMKDIGAAVSDEMGAPLPMAERLQAGAGLGHIQSTLDVLKNYHFEENVGTAVVLREPVGVIGMIKPWDL